MEGEDEKVWTAQAHASDVVCDKGEQLTNAEVARQVPSQANRTCFSSPLAVRGQIKRQYNGA